jgi:DNA-binding Lrp family transcriptional regulator
MSRPSNVHKFHGHPPVAGFSELEKHLLNDFQKGMPLSAAPFADIAQRLGVTEAEVIDALQVLQDTGVVSRVGAVFRPNRVGASTLAAMSVPEERLNDVAELVNAYVEVNHNYEREHSFNMWFVITAANSNQVEQVISDIEQRTGLSVLSLPMEEDYHIDLGFPLNWDTDSEVVV